MALGMDLKMQLSAVRHAISNPKEKLRARQGDSEVYRLMDRVAAIESQLEEIGKDMKLLAEAVINSAGSMKLWSGYYSRSEEDAGENDSNTLRHRSAADACGLSSPTDELPSKEQATDAAPTTIEPGLYWARTASADHYNMVLLVTGKPPFLRQQTVYSLPSYSPWKQGDTLVKSEADLVEVFLGPRITAPLVSDTDPALPR